MVHLQRWIPLGLAAVLGTLLLLGGYSGDTNFWVGVGLGLVGILVVTLFSASLPNVGVTMHLVLTGIYLVLGVLLLTRGTSEGHPLGVLLLVGGLVSLVFGFFGWNPDVVSLGVVLALTGVGVGIVTGNVLAMILIGVVVLLISIVSAGLLPYLKGGLSLGAK